jgi:hypothetical protein
MKNKGMRILVNGSRKVDVRIKLSALQHNVGPLFIKKNMPPQRSRGDLFLFLPQSII